MTSVVVRLDVSVGKGHLQALDDGGHVVLGLVGQGLGQDISRSNVNSLLEQIVLKNDKTGVDFCRVAHDKVPVVQYLVDIDTAPRNTPVWYENINTYCMITLDTTYRSCRTFASD